MGLCCALGLASREVVALRLQTPRKKHFACGRTGGTGARRSLQKLELRLLVEQTQTFARDGHSIRWGPSVWWSMRSHHPRQGMETCPASPCERRGEELRQEVKEPLDIPRVVRHPCGILGEGGDGCVFSFGPSLGDDLGLIPAVLLVFQQVGPTAKKPQLGLVPTLGGCSRPPPPHLSGLL